MSEQRQRRQRDVLLTTLIDLLVQVLFLLLLAVAIIAPKGDSDEVARQANELSKETGKSLPEIAEIWRRLVDPDALVKRHKELEGQHVELQARERDLEGRLKIYESRYKALGDKPCWSTESLNPETLLLVRILDDGIEARRRWPVARENELAAYLVPVELLNKKLTAQQFFAGFKPVYDSSKKASCRHYVSLEIVAKSGEKATQNRGMVETYFYLRDVKYAQR